LHVVIIQIFKLSLICRHTGTQINKLLARLALSYGRKSQMARTHKRKWISAEMQFMMRTVGYALSDCKISEIVEKQQIP
jgi:hypothetical protein